MKIRYARMRFKLEINLLQSMPLSQNALLTTFICPTVDDEMTLKVVVGYLFLQVIVLRQKPPSQIPVSRPWS